MQVVVGAGAPEPERHAARELATYLGIILNGRVPLQGAPSPTRVNLLVGERAAANVAGDAFCHAPLAEDEIAFDRYGDRMLSLRGGGPRGALYAVYELLDRQGVRWFHPEEALVPKRVRLTVPDSFRKRPDFEYREAYWHAACRDPRFAVRMRLNGSMSSIPAALGGRWRWNPYVHSFFQALPPERYARKHPEYYSFRKGQGRVVQGGQLCLSHPDVIDLLTEFALECMNDPMVRIVDLSQMDHANPCECPDCAARDRKAGSHAGSLLAMCNTVAERTSRIYPEKFIGTLAYTYTETPPRGMRAHPNVIVRLCHMEKECQTHPLDGCPANQSFLKTLRSWRRIAERVYIWDYVTNFQHLLFFHPNFDALRSDLRILRDSGVRGVFLQGFPAKGTAFNALHTYAMGRCLWDADRDYFEEARTFLKGYYGAGSAPHLWRMIRTLQRPPSSDFHLHLYRHPHLGTFTRKQLSVAESQLDKAVAAAENDGKYTERLKEVRLWMDFTRLASACPIESRPDRLRIHAAVADAPRRYERVRERIRESGLRNICEFPSSMNRLDIAWSWSLRDRDLPLVVLEDDRVRVAVSPELNGSVCGLTDKRSGIDLLCKPDPRILAYPYMTGIVEGLNVNGKALGLREFDRWEVVRRGPDRMVMRLKAGMGLHIEREISLSGKEPGIRVRSQIVNRSKHSRRVAAHDFILFRAGRLDAVHFYKRTSEGKAASLENGMRAGASQEQWVNLSGTEVPRREWGFFNPEIGLGLGERVSRAIAFCGSNGHLPTQHVLTETRLNPLVVPPGGRVCGTRGYFFLFSSPLLTPGPGG